MMMENMNNNNDINNAINDNSKNAFIRKCFDRVYGLVAIIVSDQEGAILLKGLSPHISQLTNGQVTDFDGTFPATFLLAAEQASKLPYGRNEHTISCYENFVIVQMDTSEPITTPSQNNKGSNNNTALSSSNVSSSEQQQQQQQQQQQHSNNNSGGNNSSKNNKRGDESDNGNDQDEDEQDLLTITLIATSETSIQLLLNLGPSLKQIFHNL